jgi:DNA repair protein RadD
MTELRPYQLDHVEKIEQAIADGQRRLLVVLPTGGGKTVEAAELIKRARARGQRALFVAHRREIIDQTAKRLTEHGMPLGRHGIIQAGRERDLRPQAAIQIASIDTLHHRTKRGAMDLPRGDIVFFDEAHRVRGRTREALMHKYPDAIWIGLTATACRGDGRGLGNVFTVMIEGPSTAELIKLGALVSAKVFAPVYRDVANGVATSQGDYVIAALSQRMNTAKLVGDVVSDWFRHGENRPTVAFSVDVAHAVSIRNRFRESDVAAEYISGDTPSAEREQTLAALANGEIKVVANCMVLTEGWDCPPVSCVVLARPTKQVGLYKQMIGRGLRPHEGKSDCIYLDHAGAVFKHGLPDDEIFWTLETDKRAVNITAAERKRGEAIEIAQCPECDAILGSPPPCWACGWQPKPRARDVEFIDGELGIVVGGRAQSAPLSREEQLQFYREVRGFGHQRGMTKPDEWAFYRCRDDKGIHAPYHWKSHSPLEPSPAVAAWCKSRLIAWARSRNST